MSEILDVNIQGAVTSGVNIETKPDMWGNLATVSRLAVYCRKHSGNCKNQVLALEVSPDDSGVWFPAKETLVGGCTIFNVLGKWARVCVNVADGLPSEVEIYFVTG